MDHAASVLARWNALPKNLRRAVATVAGVALVAAIVAGFLGHPLRVALFATPLHPEQLTEVEERLAGWNVAFTPTGDNVVVDATRRNDLLLRLSLAGVPHAHLETTPETLATIGVLTPEAVIDAQTRAGLAGDLEAGLRGIDGIDDARVIVAPAKAAEFADESSHEASASVRVRMREGARLSRAAIAGIRAFVAAGVSGLDAAHVAILDDRGVALGVGDDGEDASDLQTSLQSALDDAFGEGTTVVRVRAELTTEQTSQRDVRRAPLETQSLAASSHSESYVDGAKRYRRDDRNDDRGSELRETAAQSNPGAIKRLSAAVFVDESRAVDLAKVRDLAEATVGYDPRRGDTLAVAAVDFHHPLVARKDPWWLLYGTFVPLLPAVAIGLALIAAARYAAPSFADVARQCFERASAARTAKSVSGLTPSRVRGALAHEPPHAAAAIISALPAATAAAVLDLYPPHEREAIVRRMQRAHGAVVGDAEEFLRRHA